MAQSDRADGLEILELVHESVVVRDRDKITYWNSAAEALYGWPRQDALGRNLDELLQSDHAQPLTERETELFTAGRWEGELGRRTRAGRSVLVEVTWTVQRDAAGRPVGIVETGRDITEKREVEAANRRNDLRYRNLFNAMAVAFWEVDFNGVGGLLSDLRAQGVTDFRSHLMADRELVRKAMGLSVARDANPKALDLFGLRSKSEIVGRGTGQFWPVESEPAYIESLVATMEKRPHYITETRMLTARGDLIDVLFTVAWSPESRQDGVLVIGIIDISARLEAERQLRQVQTDFAHAARVATLGELTASISHEINQPLAAIAARGEASLRWLDRTDPDIEEVRDLATQIVSDARRAAGIIARIRAMATRQSAGRESLSVNDVIRETLDFLTSDLESKDVRVVFAPAEPLARIEADRTQIQQVLVNLAVNAEQAMVDHGVADRRLHILTRGNDRWVTVEVEDCGPGIPVDRLTRVFDSFFSTKAEGLGIGLAICRSIIEAHGGRIEAANTARGARFAFSLPVAEA